MSRRDRETQTRVRPWIERAWVDVAIATALSLLVFVVHPVAYQLQHPFWLDEAWVATLAKAPLARALGFASSTPIGWLLLVRPLASGHGETLRWIPLLFSAAEVGVAYALGRMLPWGAKPFARVAGLAVGTAVLLAPLSLIRDDLKQYTADACLALLVLCCANRAEGDTGRRPLVALAAVSVVSTCFSSTVSFVVAAAFAGLLLSALWARDRDRARRVLGVGAVVGVIELAYFFLVVVPHTNPTLRTFWDPYYVSASPRAFTTVWTRLNLVSPTMGVDAALAIALFAAGVVVLARIGRPGLACTVTLLWGEMMILAMARRYPLLDLRTSHFLLTVSLVTIVVGFLGIVRALLPYSPRLVAAIALVTAALYVNGAVPYIRAHSLPEEDTRAAVEYVVDHRRPGDVVVVTQPSRYGFSYYWPSGTISYEKDDAVSMGFVTSVRGLPGVVYARGLTVNDAERALSAARHERGPPAGRLFVVRSHVLPGEARAWHDAFAALHLHPETQQVGTEPIWIVADSPQS